MPKVRVGYVGCGFMAQKVHLPNLLSLPQCELLALAEVRPELGRRVQQFLAVDLHVRLGDGGLYVLRPFTATTKINSRNSGVYWSRRP